MESIRPGDHFGKLEVIGPIRRGSWLCECECGTTKVIPPSRLILSQSCGCAPGQRPNTIANIMARLIVTESGCCIWPGPKAGGGNGGEYGVVSYQGRQQYVHRLLYEYFVGPIPDGLVLDHVHCDNPPCANWAHLQPATRKNNNLRGGGSPALNARKTHCKRGHELSEENVYLQPWHGKGFSRRCLKCRLEGNALRRARYRARPKAEAPG